MSIWVTFESQGHRIKNAHFSAMDAVVSRKMKVKYENHGAQ